MAKDMTNQLDYSKYFLQFDDAILVGFLILGVGLIGLAAFILIYTRTLTIRRKIILLSTSIIYGGFILGGFPNVVFLTGLTFLILGISLIFSRIFCGYICPLGAIQELCSMVRFKPTLESNKEIKRNKILPYMRWIFFGIIFTIILILGFEITSIINPMNGFLYPWYPMNILLTIALILLIATITISFFVYRPFCRYLCPFGAIASLVSRLSPLKIRRTKSCFDCGLCEKICPTLEGYRNSNKGECYLCYRCVEFCTNEMFIDTQKLSQINRLLTTFSMNLEILSNQKNFEMILKSTIRLFIPCKQMLYFDEFLDVLNGKREFSVESIQNIVLRLREIFPNEIKNLDPLKFKEWIEQNKMRWQERINSFQQDKIIYSLAKEA